MMNFEKRWQEAFKALENILNPNAIVPVKGYDIEDVADKMFNDDDFCAELFSMPDDWSIETWVEDWLYDTYGIML